MKSHKNIFCYVYTDILFLNLTTYSFFFHCSDETDYFPITSGSALFYSFYTTAMIRHHTFKQCIVSSI